MRGVLAALMAVACQPRFEYRCSSDVDCRQDDLPGGVCEVTGYCSFPDPQCGQRYDPSAREDLAETCLDAGTPDADEGVESKTIGDRVDSDVMEKTFDTYVNKGALTTNYGDSEELTVAVGNDKITLIKFILTAIPAGATVTRVDLHLYTTDTLTAGMVKVYRMDQAWVENEATWDQPQAGYEWAVPDDPEAGLPADPILRFNPSASGPVLPIGLPPMLVQEWLADENANHGLALATDNGDNGNVSFASTEASEASQRPVLEVYYRP